MDVTQANLVGANPFLSPGGDFNPALALAADIVAKQITFLGPTRLNYDDMAYVGPGSLYNQIFMSGGMVAQQLNTDQIYTTEADSQYFPVNVIRTAGGGSPGAIATFTLQADSVEQVGGDWVSDPAERMIYFDPVRKIRLLVQAVTNPINSPTHSFTALPENTSLQLDTVYAGGAVINLVSQGQANATTDVFGQGHYRSVTRFIHTTQYLQTPNELTADAYRQLLSFQTQNGTNNPAISYFADVMPRHEMDKAVNMLTGSGTSVGGVQQTLGVLNQGLEFGQTFVIQPGNLFFSDLEDILQVAKRNSIGTAEFQFKCGNQLKSSFDTLFSTYTQNWRAQGESEDMASKYFGYGYQGVLFQGTRVVLSEILEFNSNRFINPASSTQDINSTFYANYAMCIPSNTLTTFDNKANKVVTVPQFQAISKGVPNTIDASGNGPLLSKRVYVRNPVNLGSEKYQLVICEDFGVAAYNARKIINITPN